MIYNAIQSFIDPETRLKIVLDGQASPQSLVDLFHPCQLEKRFGGTAETVTSFWPPYMGPDFIPESAKDKGDYEVMTPEKYESIIDENSELYIHPQYLKPGRTENMHFKLADDEAAR